MEITNIYISNDVIDLFIKFLNLKSKIKFSQINKYLYENYNKKYKKYKIYNIINNDYVTFYKYLQKYTFTSNEYNDLLKISLKETPIIGRACGFYDMRFIFELMFINQNNLIHINEIRIINSHFFIHFYERLKNCICPDRAKTKENIIRSRYLHSLTPFFHGLSSDDVPFNFRCIY
jgi:hypothetical protein|tara:strand:- start:331 stop:858 length:528 start_codon:yes stop_codon:yes gene_type:complete